MAFIDSQFNKASLSQIKVPPRNVIFFAVVRINNTVFIFTFNDIIFRSCLVLPGNVACPTLIPLSRQKSYKREIRESLCHNYGVCSKVLAN